MSEFPFPIPDGMKKALYQAIAYYILARGSSYQDAFLTALSSEIQNESWEPYTGEYADLDKRITEFYDVWTDEIHDQDKLNALFDAVADRLTDPAIAKEVVDTYVLAEGERVPVEEVVERLTNIVRGLDAPWPMSVYWQRSR